MSQNLLSFWVLLLIFSLKFWNYIHWPIIFEIFYNLIYPYVYLYIFIGLRFCTCNGLSLFYSASGNSASRGDSCTLSPLVLPGRALVALCCQQAPAGMSPMPSSAIVKLCVGSVRGVCRGWGGGGGLWWWCALN